MSAERSSAAWSDEAGLAALLESLGEDAVREAAALEADARGAAAQALAEAEQTARLIESLAEAAGAAEGEREARRRIALAEIETRQARLALLESGFGRAVDQAAAHLCGRLESDGALVAAWIRLAARALGEAAPRVRLTPETRARVAPWLGDDVSPVYDERADAAPGALVTSADERREVDATLPGVLARRGEEARAAAAAALLGDDAEPAP